MNSDADRKIPVILDTDIMTVPEDQVLSTRVLRTVLGGRTVYPAP